ncbi:MAG: hypothetical protein VKP62_03185 [Candidatus Sericytochromatia bacterium]|nr:hypothetical protein [Candidatus Sericytochromatia bacterium]
MPFAALRAFLEPLQNWLQARLTPAPPPRPPAPASREEGPSALPDWRAELLAESRFNWEEAVAPARALAEDGGEAGPAPTLPAAPLPWVAPQVDQPAARFARLGYAPGARPPSLMALKDLFEAVYGPCLAPLPTRVLHDTALFGGLDGWNPAAGNDNLGRLHVVFRQLSELLGEAFAFKPAPLGRVDHHRQLGGYYDHQAQAIFLATSLLRSHPAAVANTIAHEQFHRLQHLLIQRLMYAPRKLSSAERSLAMYWHAEGTAEPGADFAAYRYNGREYHADQTAKALVRLLMPVFDWPPQVLAY